MAHRADLDKFRFQHKAESRKMRADHSAELQLRKKKILQLQDDQVMLMRTYEGMVDENREYRRQLRKRGNDIETSRNISNDRLQQIRDIRDLNLAKAAKELEEQLDME